MFEIWFAILLAALAAYTVGRLLIDHVFTTFGEIIQHVIGEAE